MPRLIMSHLAVLLFFGSTTFHATVVSAQPVINVCPGVTVGLVGGTSGSVYSDCVMENVFGAPGLHVSLTHNPFGNFVQTDGRTDGFLAPAPGADINFGRFNGLDLVTENMGPSYTGLCLDMTTPNPSVSTNILPVDGDVYCGRVTNLEGNSVYVRGRLDLPGNTWTQALVLTTQPGVGTPFAAPKVPTVPPLLLLMLCALVVGQGVRGLRRKGP